MPLSADSSSTDGLGGTADTPEALQLPAPSRWQHWQGLKSLLVPLRVRNFRLLLSGQTLSDVGDAFSTVALPWFVLTRGGGPQILGLMLGAFGVARASTIILGGMLSDRLGARRVMLFADAARALLVGTLAVLAIWWQHPALWQLCAIAVPLGAATGLFLPAYFAIMPTVLPDDDLQAGNSLNTASAQFIAMVGPAIAGIVVSILQVGVAFVIDSCTFLASITTLILMGREREHPSPPTSKSETVHDEDAPTAPAAMPFSQLLRSSRLFQLALLVMVISSLTFDGMIEVALPALAHGLGVGAGGYGAMFAAFAGGALTGGLGAGLLGRLRSRSLLALSMLSLEAISLAIVPFAGSVIGTVLALVMAGLARGLVSVLFLTLVQQLLPRHLMGRIMAAFMMASYSLYPLSVILSGAATARWGAGVVFIACGISMMGAATFGFSQREIRAVEQ